MGTLPSQTEINPKEDVHAAELRSGRKLDEPLIKKESQHVQVKKIPRKTETACLEENTRKESAKEQKCQTFSEMVAKLEEWFEGKDLEEDSWTYNEEVEGKRILKREKASKKEEFKPQRRVVVELVKEDAMDLDKPIQESAMESIGSNDISE